VSTSWTHSICSACWNKKFPDHPIFDADAASYAVCCWCLLGHRSGTWLNEDPTNLQCHHGEVGTTRSRRHVCCIPKCGDEATFLLVHDEHGEKCAHVVCALHRYWPNHTAQPL
jgi:hypothetical protein